MGKRIYANDIADFGQTICYEVLCGIRRKVPRIYLSNDEIVNIREYIL